MTYPAAGRALKKWRDTKQDQVPAGDEYSRGAQEFTFRYDGSTCNNGGTPFHALLHTVVAQTDNKGWSIEAAWIEIPEDQKEAASEMCAVPGKGTEEGESFFVQLGAPADFVGRDLESVILEEKPTNYAGCFCNSSHRNQKWEIALSTIHYTLTAD